MSTSARLRRGLVETLEHAGHIRSPAVREAFLAVPREHFLPAHLAEHGLAAVYANDAIVTKKDAAGLATSSSSAPSIMAIMLEQLDLRPGMRVLEIGAGTGYNAALLKHIVGPRGRVVSIDIDPRTGAEARANLRRHGARVRVVTGDGRRGWKDGARYDRVVATASSPDVPRAWMQQVVEGGLVEVPLKLNGQSFLRQAVVTFRKERGRLASVGLVRGGFMSLRASADDPADVGPYAVVEMRGTGPPSTIAGLTGEVFFGLDDEHRRRLVSLALGRLQRSSFSFRTSNADGLHVFLIVAGRPREEVAGGWGVATRDAKSFAALRNVKGRFTIWTAGDDRAERRLTSLVERWRTLGSPSLEDLRIAVSYGRQRPRAWRIDRRGTSWLTFDWSEPAKHS